MRKIFFEKLGLSDNLWRIFSKFFWESEAPRVPDLLLKFQLRTPKFFSHGALLFIAQSGLSAMLMGKFRKQIESL